MLNSVWTKGLVIGIIMLFVGTSVLPLVISKDALQTNLSNQIEMNGFRDWSIDGDHFPSTVFQHDRLFFKNQHVPLLDTYIRNTGELSQEQDINIGYSVHQTNDNGYIIGGYTGRVGYAAGLLIKTNTQGFESWNKTYFIKLDTVFYSVDQTSDGGYITTGFTYDGLNDTSVLFLCKSDNQGNKLWHKTYENFFDTAAGLIVRQTSDGGYIVSGVKENTESGNTDGIILLKTDSEGTMIWFNIFRYTVDVYWVTVQQTSEGGYILGGSCGDLSQSTMSAFLWKIDEYGNDLWNTTYDVLESTFCYSVIQSHDDGFVLVGYTTSGSLGGQTMIIKTDTSGRVEWKKTYEGNNSLSVKQTADNGFIIGGVTYLQNDMHALLLKTDFNGNKIWSKTYSGIGAAVCIDVIETEDKGYVMTGISGLLSNSGVIYTLLLKTDKSGNILWSRYFNIPDPPVGSLRFYGWDVDNSTYFLAIKIGQYTMFQGSSFPLGFYETDYLERCPGTYVYNITWYGKEKRQSVMGYVTISAGENKSILQNLTFCDDIPQIQIMKPKNGLYVNNNKILPFFIPVVIGDIDIQVDAADSSSGIWYVQFYIDNELLFQDDSEPYSLQWQDATFGIHHIKVVAYDKVGYNKSEEISVWRIF